MRCLWILDDFGDVFLGKSLFVCFGIFRPCSELPSSIIKMGNYNISFAPGFISLNMFNDHGASLILIEDHLGLSTP